MSARRNRESVNLPRHGGASWARRSVLARAAFRGATVGRGSGGGNRTAPASSALSPATAFLAVRRIARRQSSPLSGYRASEPARCASGYWQPEVLATKHRIDRHVAVWLQTPTWSRSARPKSTPNGWTACGIPAPGLGFWFGLSVWPPETREMSGPWAKGSRNFGSTTDPVTECTSSSRVARSSCCWLAGTNGPRVGISRRRCGSHET